MKKHIVYLAILLPILSFAQTFSGFQSDNYSGVQSVVFNPANIVDSNFRSDINIVSVNGNFDNDYIGVNFKDLLKGKELNYGDNASKSPSSNNSFYVGNDYLGPSFTINISPKHSVALFTRVQSIGNVNGIDGELYERVDTNLNATSDWTIDDNGSNITQHTWGEFGIAYATVLMNKKQHFLKGGVSLKYLQGILNSYIKTGHIHVDYDASATGAELDTQGELEYATSSDLDSNEFKLQKGANGIGFDLGLIYEWRPEEKDSAANKYKLKFGLSITDIGSIKYNSFKHKEYLLNGTGIDENIFDNNDFEDALQILADANVYSETNLSGKIKVNLPTALHLNADWNLKNKWYLNFNSDIKLTPTLKKNTNNIISTQTLTARYETKWLTLQLPVTHSALKNTFVGFGFRAGPVFVGSSSIITNLISNDSKAANLYVGLKIPLYKK